MAGMVKYTLSVKKVKNGSDSLQMAVLGRPEIYQESI
jgi:hypothetical protein